MAAWHAGEIVVALTKHYHLTLRAGIDGPGCVGDVGWPGINRQRIAPLYRRTLIRRRCLGGAGKTHSSAEQQGRGQFKSVGSVIPFARFDVANAFWF